MNTTWEVLFDPKVIAKAEKLMASNIDMFPTLKIKPSAAGDIIIFTVKDQQKYHVRIKLANDPANYQMSCNCRDGIKGKKCRHMALTLMAWSFMAEISSPAEAERIENAMSVAQTASIESIRAFLLRLFTRSEDAFQLFQEEFPEEVAGISAATYFDSEIDKVISRFQFADGLVDGNKLAGLKGELAAALSESTEFLLAELDWRSAWEVIIYTLKRVSELQIDDRLVNYSQESVRTILTMIHHEWENLLEEADDDFTEFAFNDLHQLIASGEFTPLLLEIVLKFYCGQFAGRELRQQQLNLLQKKYKSALEVYMQKRDEDQLGPWVTALIRVLTDLDKADQAAELFGKHGDLFTVRLLDLEIRYSQGGWDEAKIEIEQLQDTVKNDPDKLNQLLSLSLELMMTTFEQDYAAKQAKFAAFTKKWKPFGNPGKYLKMKDKLTEEQWPVYKKEYLEAFDGRFEKFENLRIEGDLPTLFAQLQQADAYDYWRKYRDLFAADHPDLYLNAYEAEVRDKLTSSSQGRPYYKKTAQIIAAMYDFAGGAERAEALISELISLYAKRPALVAELEQVRRK